MGGTSTGTDVINDLLTQFLQHLRFLGKHIQHKGEGRGSLRKGCIISEAHIPGTG